MVFGTPVVDVGVYETIAVDVVVEVMVLTTVVGMHGGSTVWIQEHAVLAMDEALTLSLERIKESAAAPGATEVVAVACLLFTATPGVIVVVTVAGTVAVSVSASGTLKYNQSTSRTGVVPGYLQGGCHRRRGI